MKINNIIFYSLIFQFCSVFSMGHTYSRKEFQSFAKIQDSLMNKAYEKRDIKTYKRFLDKFISKYDNLQKSEKEYFKPYYYGSFYNLCCTYSLLNDKEDALDYLGKSIKAGYMDYSHIMVDSDLDNIRKESSFTNIILPLRETGDYLYILKKAGKYNTNENKSLPEFTYQSPENPSLVALRKTYKLDSIAGTGNDVSRILNLLHWVHNLIPHDGNHENPTIMNTPNMITVCKAGNRGLNCRGLATVLNECYLAMGIKSRFVTCLPKDSLKMDPDCHVINMVYSSQLKKWLWVDPTFDAYVMNEKGDLLSIEEVRDRIINDKPLILDPEANWNHKNSETKEHYLYYYLAKNLYLLECPLNSEYDAETRHEGKFIRYVQLIPLDYFKKSTETSTSFNPENKTTFITFKTNNPNSFWKLPE